MKIVLSMRNGHTFELPDCTEKDFEMLISHMKSFRDSFLWNNAFWVRKADVLGIVLKPEELK